MAFLYYGTKVEILSKKKEYFWVILLFTATYSIGVTLLFNMIDVVSKIIESALDRRNDLITWWDALKEMGRKFGYYPEPK